MAQDVQQLKCDNEQLQYMALDIFDVVLDRLELVGVDVAQWRQMQHVDAVAVRALLDLYLARVVGDSPCAHLDDQERRQLQTLQGTLLLHNRLVETERNLQQRKELLRRRPPTPTASATQLTTRRLPDSTRRDRLVQRCNDVMRRLAVTAAIGSIKTTSNLRYYGTVELAAWLEDVQEKMEETAIDLERIQKIMVSESMLPELSDFNRRLRVIMDHIHELAGRINRCREEDMTFS